MNKVIIYTETDGSLACIIPATTDLTIEQIAEKDVPQGIDYRIINASDLPIDRTYRNAWIWDDGVKIDEAKKQQIQSSDS